jgi:hypothetical protein
VEKVCEKWRKLCLLPIEWLTLRSSPSIKAYTSCMPFWPPSTFTSPQFRHNCLQSAICSTVSACFQQFLYKTPGQQHWSRDSHRLTPGVPGDIILYRQMKVTANLSYGKVTRVLGCDSPVAWCTVLSPPGTHVRTWRCCTVASQPDKYWNRLYYDARCCIPRTNCLKVLHVHDQLSDLEMCDLFCTSRVLLLVKLLLNLNR